ncbi:MAG: hypothetical protein ACHBN1_37200 [Heteroscytonema crispum UTEX LB 1556]
MGLGGNGEMGGEGEHGRQGRGGDGEHGRQGRINPSLSPLSPTPHTRRPRPVALVPLSLLPSDRLGVQSAPPETS